MACSKRNIKKIIYNTEYFYEKEAVYVKEHINSRPKP
jgi:hypothetical protein